MPEFAVDRTTLSKFFRPGISKSTFHDLVSKGKIVPVDGIRGYYRLNESLVRLGLQPVAELPGVRGAGDREIVELALAIAAPDVQDAPMWILDGLKQSDVARALVLARQWESVMEQEKITDPAERRAFVQGVMDGQWMLEREGRSALDGIPGDKG